MKKTILTELEHYGEILEERNYSEPALRKDEIRMT